MVSGGGALTEADFSLAALFERAHWLVQLVIVILALSSIWSWAIIVEKAMIYGRLRRKIELFEETFWSGKPLDHLFDDIGGAPSSPIERVFVAGMREWTKSVETGTGLFLGLRDRLDRAMTVALARETESVERRLSHLATIGAITPFIGLFGTVWGIKNSFEAIALQQNANITVVAPGIAEALVATALGLFAAIPAVIAYNQLLGGAQRINGRLENFVDEFATILSRQLDKRGV
ncbi:MAG: protein TolQ [Pseudomonadota bacterium]